MGKFLHSEYPPRLGRLWAVTLLAAIFLFSSIPVVCASVTADYQADSEGGGFAPCLLQCEERLS